MSLGMYTIKKKDLPKYVSMSQDHLSRCEQMLIIKYVGYDYYIPVTPEVNKVLKLFESKRFNTRTEDFFRDVISSVYTQIRDSVALDIQTHLEYQISEGFKNMFEKRMRREIKKRLNEKMLPEKTGMKK